MVKLVYFQMGVHEIGLRKSIMREIEKVTNRQQEEDAASKAKKLDEPYEVFLLMLLRAIFL